MKKQKDYLHYTPEDGWFGDPMPLYHNGVYHVYYTKLHPTGRLVWGHISSYDLIHYTEHPDPFTLDAPNSPRNTGCVFWGEGKFHAYYALYSEETGRYGMYHCESGDGILFTRQPELCFERPEQWYQQDGTFRDPFVFFDSDSGLYRMVFCAKEKREGDSADFFSGTVGQAVSRDLKIWECLPPLKITGVGTTLECPEVYRDGDRWVLIYYWRETRFRTAAALDGLWERGAVISPDHFDFMAGRHLFDGRRHLLFGWIPRRDCDCAERIWGGHMLFPRELRMEDGRTSKTRFAREITRLFSRKDGNILPEKAILCGEKVEADGNGLRFAPVKGGCMALWESLADCCYIQMDIGMSSSWGTVSILLGNQGKTEKGYALHIDPSEGVIRLRRHYEWDQSGEIAEVPCRCAAGRKIRLEILRHNQILEVCVNTEQTLVSRLLEDSAGGMAIAVWDCDARISDLHVYTRDGN